MNDDENLEFTKRLNSLYPKLIKSSLILLAAFIVNLVLVLSGVVNEKLILILTSYNTVSVAAVFYFKTMPLNNRSSLEFQKRRNVYGFLSIMSLALLIASIILSVIDYRFLYLAITGSYRVYTEIKLLILLYEDFIEKLKKKIKNKAKSFKESFSAGKSIVPVPTV